MVNIEYKVNIVNEVNRVNEVNDKEVFIENNIFDQ
jgi:hypothetical protein